MFTRGEPVIHIMFQTGTPLESKQMNKNFFQLKLTTHSQGTRSPQRMSVSLPSSPHFVLRKICVNKELS